MVHDWIFNGICSDMYGEFMLQVNQEYLSQRGLFAVLAFVRYLIHCE